MLYGHLVQTRHTFTVNKFRNWSMVLSRNLSKLKELTPSVCEMTMRLQVEHMLFLPLPCNTNASIGTNDNTCSLYKLFRRSYSNRVSYWNTLGYAPVWTFSFRYRMTEKLSCNIALQDQTTVGTLLYVCIVIWLTPSVVKCNESRICQKNKLTKVRTTQ